MPVDWLRANGSFGNSVNGAFGKNLKHKLRKSLWALALLVLTSASYAGTLSIESAEAWGNTIYVKLNFAPRASILDALDASVPLKFVFRQRVPGSMFSQNAAEQTITLSYAPLLERFELISNATLKPYRLRAELLDAFSNLQLTGAKDATEVRLSLSIGALPAPLRLPAILNSDWWLDSGWVTLSRGDGIKSGGISAVTPGRGSWP